MQPKKYITPIKYREKAFGLERRENYTKEIMHNEPYFPKPLEYEDIDKAVLEFVLSLMGRKFLPLLGIQTKDSMNIVNHGNILMKTETYY